MLHIVLYQNPPQVALIASLLTSILLCRAAVSHQTPGGAGRMACPAGELVCVVMCQCIASVSIMAWVCDLYCRRRAHALHG